MTFQQISNTWWYRLLKVIWIISLIIIALLVCSITYSYQIDNVNYYNHHISEAEQDQVIGWTLFSGVMVQLIFIGIRQIFLYIVIGNNKTEA